MKITFNGTGASEGFPALFCECEHCTRARTMDAKNFRKRSSCLIDDGLLIDFSADTYAHCLYGRLDLTRVENILFTHSHSDHLYPQDLMKIMPPFGLHRRKKPLRMYGNAVVEAALRKDEVLEGKASSYLSFSAVEPFSLIDVDGYAVTPLPAKHDPGQVCLVYLIEKEGKAVFYGHDSGIYPEGTWEALRGAPRLNAVVLDCTTGPHPCDYGTHMGVPENRLVKQRMLDMGVAGPDTRFVLTHFAHSGAPFYDDMEKLAVENGFVAAHDGFVMNL